GPFGRSRSLAEGGLEARVVADGSEVVVLARLLAEGLVQLDRPAEMLERLVAGLACEGGEAGVVVVEPGIVRHPLEPTAHRVERVWIPLLAVGLHRLLMKRPCVAPVEPLIGLAGSSP